MAPQKPPLKNEGLPRKKKAGTGCSPKIRIQAGKNFENGLSILPDQFF
jgi:hypothetical protein